MKTLKYTELFDFVLRTLYDIRNLDPNIYLSIPQILKVLEYKATYSDTIELAKYLESRGWIKVLYMLGDVRAQISTAGIVRIEELSDKFSEEFIQYMNQLSDKEGKKITLDVFFQETDSKNQIFELLNEISKKIKEKEGYETDFNKDIEIIKIELTKLKPDFDLLERKLEFFSNLNYIISDLQEAKELISI